MSFTFFPDDALEFAHVGGDDGRADELEMVDLGGFGACLVVLDEDLDVLDVLEFDEAESDWGAFEVLGFQTVDNKYSCYKGHFNISTRSRSPLC